jgi:hypothetical protein
VWRAPNVFGSRRKRFIANDAAPRKAKKVMLDTEKLQAFSRLPSRLLTVYLNSNPGKPANRGPSPEYMAWLHSAAQSALGQLPRDEQRLFRIQVERVQAFLRDRVSSARSELIFAGANAWMHMPLDGEIEVVAQAFDSGLRQCNDCGWADRSLAEACPACGGARRRANLREVLPELAWNHGVEIEVISGNAAARLVRAGGIAAKLRQARKPGEKRMAGQTR